MMASLDNSTSCDTGLVLGIGSFSSTAKNSTTTHDHDQNTNINNYPTSMRNDNYEPLLTLCLSDQQKGRQASPNSTISSSMSVKRERDMNGSHEDHDEDIDTDNNVRKKLRLTKQQSAFLEDSFKQHSTLNPKQKQALARQLNLRPRQVEVWFQNRRARSKLKQTEVDCDFLKKCCEKLSEENKKLQKEVQDLKAATLKPVPFYIQPALSMCPSCEKTTDINQKQQTPFVHHFFNPFANPSSAAC